MKHEIEVVVTPLRSVPTSRFAGVARVPGDKSISHRALLLAASAVGESPIRGLLEGEDVMRTAAALRALGAEIERGADGWVVRGVGVGGLREPECVLDLGNSGTGVRLLMGLAASQPIFCCFTGDTSLNRRPMTRVTAPLSEMGARFVGRADGHLPLAMSGARKPLPIVYRLPVASAQVKSAILLAALNTPGETTVIEPSPTRDHSERMLRHFGAALRVEEGEAGERAITLVGEPELAGRPLQVPGDPSSAAFPLVAAACLEGAEVTVPGVAVNPTRCGLLACLREMGAKVTLAAAREEGGEPVADVTVRGGRLDGIAVPAARAPSMIDEYPALAVAAACARGRTVMEGIGELRLKESDRLAAMAEGLSRAGVTVAAHHDRLEIDGCGGPPPGGATIESRLDHRIAMAFLVLGAVARQAVTVDDGAMIATSFPGFVPLMNELGANIAAPS